MTKITVEAHQKSMTSLQVYTGPSNTKLSYTLKNSIKGFEQVFHRYSYTSYVL